MSTRTTSLIAVASIFLSASWLSAGAKTYDFKDPKGVNNVSFILDAPLESISGNAKGITGTIDFDPKSPEAVKGQIVISTGSLTVTNDTMRDHMLGDGWLDAEGFPEITFAAKSVGKVESTKKGFKAHVTGDLTLKGITKEMTIPVNFTHLPDMLSARTNGAAEGDLLVVRSTFTINRSEFGIKSGQATDKVAEEIELRLSIAGAAPDA